MAIFLTGELPKIFSRTPGKTLAYFFCDSNFETQKTATAIIRGLLFQLVQQDPKLLDHVTLKYSERGGKVFESFDSVWPIFEEIAAECTGILFCIIDALDECDYKSQQIILRQLETLQHANRTPNLKILITSRPFPEIREYLEDFAEAANLAGFPGSREDVTRFIHEKVATLQKRKKYTDTVAARVQHILQEKAQGTFLWIGLVCEELDKVRSKDAIATLNRMPSGLHALFEALLHSAIQLEKETRRDEKDVIKRILGFVSVSQRPLSMLELSEACHLHEKEELDTRVQFLRDEIDSCRLMVIIQDDKVILLHQSIKDFLTGASGKPFLDEQQVHADTAFRCINQLLHCIQRETTYQRTLLIPFSSYSIDFWPEHARMARTKFQIQAAHTQFFAVVSPTREQWLRYLRQRSALSSPLPSEFSVLHVAARWGITPLVEYLLSKRLPKNLNRGDSVGRDVVDINGRDLDGRTALEEASYKGHTDIINRLLDEGVLVTSREARAAAKNTINGKEVMALLLDRRGDQIAITEPIVAAAAENTTNGKEVMALLLDRRGDQIAITEPIVAAAAKNTASGKEVMALLLKRRKDQVVLTEAIVTAAANNTTSGKEIMALLLDRCGDQIVDTQKFGQLIARQFDEAITSQFLDRHRIVVTNDMAEAVVLNHWHSDAIMKMLLSRQELTITNMAIPIIAQRFDETMVRFLLDRQGIQVKISYQFAWDVAFNYPKDVAMKMLLNRQGTVITASAVPVIAKTYDEVMISLLLDRHGSNIQITAEIIKAIAENHLHREGIMRMLICRKEIIIAEAVIPVLIQEFNEEAIRLLFRRRDHEIHVTEEVLAAAARNRWYGKAVMAFFLDLCGNQLTITEAVVQAAAANDKCGAAIVTMLLLYWRGDPITITEAIVWAAATNYSDGEAFMSALLQGRGDQITMTESAVLAVAENHNEDIMFLLLDWQGSLITVTDDIIQAAARNRWFGKSVMRSLLNRCGNEISITPAIIQAAAKNEISGSGVTKALLDWWGDPVPTQSTLYFECLEWHSKLKERKKKRKEAYFFSRLTSYSCSAYRSNMRMLDDWLADVPVAGYMHSLGRYGEDYANLRNISQQCEW